MIRAIFFVLLSTAAFAQSSGNAVGPNYKVVPDWLTLPEGRTEIGSMHGDVAVSSTGDVYISVEGTVRQRYAILGPNPGLQVYSPDGKFLRNVPNAPFDFHGFIIHKEPAGEFIYGTRLAAGPSQAEQTRAGVDQQAIVKMTLDGNVVLTIPASRIPDQFKNKTDDGRAFTRLTGITVAQNGDIFATDGYASDYVHRFDRSGKYLKSFGGKSGPYNFKTLHRIAIDSRFSPARIIAVDRANNRVVHLSLDGEFLGVIATDMLLPAAVAIHGDYAAIAELRGQSDRPRQGGQGRRGARSEHGGGRDRRQQNRTWEVAAGHRHRASWHRVQRAGRHIGLGVQPLRSCSSVQHATR